MKKSSKSCQVFARNLESVMKAHNLGVAEIARQGTRLGYKITGRTINNVLNCRNEAGLDKLEAISLAVGLEPWQMLMPNLSRSVFSQRNKNTGRLTGEKR